MAQITTGYPIVFRYGGDIMHEFAEKYIKEIDRIYYFLNKVRTLDPDNKFGIEPTAGQLSIKDGKLYVRNEENTGWEYLGDLKYNFGFTNSEDERVLTTNDLATVDGEVGKIPVTDETGRLPCNITGDAGRLGGFGIKTDSIKDGQGLFFRRDINGWRNENKGVAGSGKTLTVRDGNKILATYNGNQTAEFDIGLAAIKATIDEMPVKVNGKLTNISDIVEQYLQGARNEAGDRLDNLTAKINEDFSAHDTSDDSHADIRTTIRNSNTRIAAMMANLNSVNTIMSFLKNRLGLTELWDATKTYQPKEVVVVDENIYRAITVTQGDYPPGNADKWQLLTMPTKMWEFDEYGDIMPFDEATGVNPVAFAFERDGSNSLMPCGFDDV